MSDSDGGLDRAGRSGNLDVLLQDPRDYFQAKEGKSLALLLYLLKTYAPHMSASFVSSERWWHQHEGLPEAHVSPSTHLSRS